MGERSEDASIPFEDVKVDSNANWIPEILGRAKLSEPEFMVFKHFDQDAGTILDIGANYGYAAASIWAAGAKSKILSFEPNPWHRPCLLRIKEMRPALFDFIHLGLGSTDSSNSLHSSGDRGDRDQCPQLCGNGSRDRLGTARKSRATHDARSSRSGLTAPAIHRSHMAHGAVG